MEDDGMNNGMMKERTMYEVDARSFKMLAK
jgi:hypothetical protein